MTKIKILGIFIFIFSITLAILFSLSSQENKKYNALINNINTKKEFTQEISKNIFYIYKNKNISHKKLLIYIKKFKEYVDKKDNNFDEITNKEIEKQNKRIIKSWNEFYLEVQEFRDQSKIVTPYFSIIKERTVNNIYNKNLMLLVEFDKLNKMYKIYFENELNKYKEIQYTLFFLLVVSLLYLFTQLKIIITFVQKFLHTSQNIITNSSIKELEPIEIKNKSAEISKATDNFNHLVQNINSSIHYSSKSIKHSIESLELVENNIEDLLELIDTMQENEIDKELTKKEDALIDSLEELTASTQKLKDLKINLDNLTS